MLLDFCHSFTRPLSWTAFSFLSLLCTCFRLLSLLLLILFFLLSSCNYDISFVLWQVLLTKLTLFCFWSSSIWVTQNDVANNAHVHYQFFNFKLAIVSICLKDAICNVICNQYEHYDRCPTVVFAIFPMCIYLCWIVCFTFCCYGCENWNRFCWLLRILW